MNFLPWQFERLDGGVLDVDVGVHSVPDEGLDDGVLRGAEEVVGPKLRKKQNCLRTVLRNVAGLS